MTGVDPKWCGSWQNPEQEELVHALDAEMTIHSKHDFDFWLELCYPWLPDGRGNMLFVPDSSRKLLSADPITTHKISAKCRYACQGTPMYRHPWNEWDGRLMSYHDWMEVDAPAFNMSDGGYPELFGGWFKRIVKRARELQVERVMPVKPVKPERPKVEERSEWNG